MKLRKFFLHNWQAKLICLLLAAVIWYVLREAIHRSAI